MCTFPPSGLFLLDSALFQIEGTLCPECAPTFSSLNDCGFLRYAACLLCGTDGSHGPSAFTSLILGCKNTPCQSLCFYFLVGKSSRCPTWTAVEGSPSPASGEMPFSQTESNSAKFGLGLSPVVGPGGAGVMGSILMCLSWNVITSKSVN